MAYVRLDKIKNSAHIESIVHEEDLKNGQFLDLGVLHEDLDGEATEVTKTAEGGAYQALLVSEFLNYEGRADFDYAAQVTKAGKAGRAYILEPGNMISVTEDLINGTIAVGDDVAIGAEGLGFKKADVDEVVVGKAIGEDYLANIGELLVVRFK